MRTKLAAKDYSPVRNALQLGPDLTAQIQKKKRKEKKKHLEGQFGVNVSTFIPSQLVADPAPSSCTFPTENKHLSCFTHNYAVLTPRTDSLMNSSAFRPKMSQQ